MDLAFVSKIDCAPRHRSVAQTDYSQTFCQAHQMIPTCNNYQTRFLREEVKLYREPPRYTVTRSYADR